MHPVEKFLEWIYASRSRALIVVLALVAVTGFVDYATGYAMAFSLFYLLAVLLATHVLGKQTGFLIAGLAAGIWTFTDFIAGMSYSSMLTPAWNTVMRFGVLATVAYLMIALETEMEHSRRDFLTNLNNRRQFAGLFEAERNRSTRSGKPYSLLYLDINHFKILNDTLGHAAGDEALRVVARALLANSRRMDVPARMGGDEFAVLLPDTDATECRAIAERIDRAIAGEFESRRWPIGISIGMATTRGFEATIEDILHAADRTMYQVKHRGTQPESG